MNKIKKILDEIKIPLFWIILMLSCIAIMMLIGYWLFVNYHV